jgi:lipopolysaccharide transport system ATP-binding protein
MKPIIRVENLGKQYRIGGPQAAYSTLRESLAGAIRSPLKRILRGGRSTDETFWALSDVNFEVAPGEVIGIIGRNGAGKSTLLKVLSRITEPTTGRIELYGRVASLLEVGTGFHPELTGRENVYLNGAILGMRRTEIESKFDEIVAFAELEKFLDTPVKRYSSGMYMRLAFAVASHLEPEILVVDEVLAVGDAQFQKKCLGKMSDVSKQGRTVLFVSHNMTAVQSLCRRAAWLQQGRIVDEGAVSDVVSNYLKTASQAAQEQIWDDIETAPGNEQVRIRRASVRPLTEKPDTEITISTPFVIEFEFWNLQPDAYLNLSLVLYNEAEVAVFNTGPTNEPNWHGRPFPVGLFRSSCFVPGNLLNDGAHRVQLFVIRDQSAAVFIYDEVLVFDVRDSLAGRGPWHGKVIGAVRPQLEWRTELVEADAPTALSSASHH